jgi:hypothetical protein
MRRTICAVYSNFERTICTTENTTESRSSITNMFHNVVEKRYPYQCNFPYNNKKFLVCLEPAGSLRCLLNPATLPYRKPVQSNLIQSTRSYRPGYGLDDRDPIPGSSNDGTHLSAPAPRPAPEPPFRPPIQWARRLLPRGQRGRGAKPTTTPTQCQSENVWSPASTPPTRPHGVVVKYRKNLPLSFLILPFIYPFTSLSNRYLPLGFPTRMMVTCLPFRMFVTCPVPFHHPSFI